MATVEGRILGSDPRATARAKLDQKFRVEPENPKNNWVEGLPHIFFGDPGVRYAPFQGTLWIASYHPSNAAPDIALKRWSKHSSIETATGASAEILGNYSATGDIALKTLALDQFIRTKLDQFGEGNLTDQQLAEFRTEADKAIQDLGFSNPKKPSKTIVTERVRRAMGRDSIGRLNPLISRTRLASALLTLLTENEFQDKVATKHLGLFIAFLGEQQLEESYIVSILKEFSKGNFKPDVLKDAALKPVVKASPFRIPLMQAYCSMFGIPPHRQKEFERYFENDEDLFATLNNPDVPLEERQRIVASNLQTALEDGISIYNPSV